MDTITVPKKELQAVVKEVLKEALTEEFMAFRALLLPYVSAKEHQDIEKRYGRPSRKAVKSREVKI